MQIGHNVVIGRDCLICAQAGIAGSTVIGDRVVLGGQVGVADNIFVGDDVITGGGTGSSTNVPAGPRACWAIRRCKMETQSRCRRHIRRLPRLFAQVARAAQSCHRWLRTRLWNGGACHGQQRCSDRVIAIIAEQAVLEPGEVRLDMTLEDFGIDSLGLVEALFAIEEKFDISVPFNANEPDETDFDISSVGGDDARGRGAGRGQSG